MASIWQFVADMASASPAVNLDLNANGMRVLLGWKLGPTLFEKGYAGGPLRHGKRPTRSTAVNQVLEIPVEINKASEALGAQAVEDLVRQLAVDNVLKVQLDGAPAPVFFRTFGDADFAAAVRTVLIRDTTVTLQIEAEPFAHGPRVEVTGSPFTVSADPAAGTNPMRFDVTGVLGDTETPLLLHITSTGTAGRYLHVATRRRGTPGGYANLVQAESMTPSTDTSASTASAGVDAGVAIQRVTFATNTAMTLRLSDQFPSNNVATVEARGEYIVYARLRKTTGADTIAVQLKYGTDSSNNIANDAVTLPAVSQPIWINLGKVPVPAFADPVTHGFSGVKLKALLSWVGFYAQRVSGTGQLEVDCLYFMPADEQTLIVALPATDTTYALDGTTDAGGSVYAMSTALDEVLGIASPPQITGGGGFPSLIPGATNRIHVLRERNDPAGTAEAMASTSTTIRAYYWPRWREFTRP